MDISTQPHLATLRQRLTDRLAELRVEVRAEELMRRAAAADGRSDVSDRKDEAQREQFDEVDRSQERRDLDELDEVEGALRRLDGGRYGDCADCGEPIDVRRLLVQPAASRCAACQSAREEAAGPHQPMTVGRGTTHSKGVR